MQIGEPCFWTTLHGFTGDTLLIICDIFFFYFQVGGYGNGTEDVEECVEN